MNVAIGLINLKNSASLGDCPSIGCDTNTNEYSTVATMNVNVSDSTMPTMNRSSSSGDHSLVGFMLFFFFACIYQPFGAVTHSYAARLLAEFVLPVFRVLAVVAVAVFAARQQQYRQ
jgi:hypothetical protein